MDMDPQSSQNDHIVRWPLGPAAQAIRSLGIWEQFVLSLYICKYINATFIGGGFIDQYGSIGPARYWSSETYP